MKLLKEEIEVIMACKCNIIIDCAGRNINELKHFIKIAKDKDIHLTLRNLKNKPKEAIALATDQHGFLTIEV